MSDLRGAAPVRACSSGEEVEFVEGGERRCPMCGEPIKAGARKCPHCREILDKGLARERQFRRMKRRGADMARERRSSPDSEVGVFDFLVCLIPLIALIIGFVALLRGHGLRGAVVIGGGVVMSFVYIVLTALSHMP